MTENVIGGYMGKILRVNLSSEQLSEESPDNETLRKHIGGTGLGTKYLYEEVPPGVEWSDPENRIMFFAGPLSGTKVSGSGIFSIITKGPMTNREVMATAADSTVNVIGTVGGRPSDRLKVPTTPMATPKTVV